MLIASWLPAHAVVVHIRQVAVGSRCFSIAVIWNFSLWTAERGGRYMQVVAKAGFTVAGMLKLPLAGLKFCCCLQN